MLFFVVQRCADHSNPFHCCYQIIIIIYKIFPIHKSAARSKDTKIMAKNNYDGYLLQMQSLKLINVIVFVLFLVSFTGAQFFHPILNDQEYLKMIEVSLGEEVKTAEADMLTEVGVLKNLTDILLIAEQLSKKKELESGQPQISTKVKGTKQGLATIVDSVDEAVDNQLAPAVGGFVVNNVDALSQISRIFFESVKIAFPGLVGNSTTGRPSSGLSKI